MSKNQKIDTFFQILCLNDSKEVRKFLLENGKSPKPICPVMFEKEKEDVSKSE